MTNFRSIGVFFFVLISMAGVQAQSKINWLSWEEALRRNKVEQRKFVVDIYTDWCGWCKRLDKVTFQNEDVADYINEHYYAIKFNAEQRKSVTIGDKTYKFVNKNKRGYHELAAALTQGNLSYPTVVFLDSRLRTIQALKGFHSPKDFKVIISYFAADHYKTTPWKKFASNYNH